MRKNGIMMVLYEVLCLFVPLIITPYISRVLGAEAIGIYSYTYSVATYFVITIQLGIKLYGRREIAKVNHSKEEYSKVFFELIYLETAMFALVSVLYAAFVFVFVDNEVYRGALLIQYIEMMVALLDISWLYFGLEKFTAIIIRNVIVRIGEILFIFLLIHSEKDVYAYIAIMAACNFFGVLSMWVDIRSKLVRAAAGKYEIKKHVIPMIKLFIPVLSTTLFSIVDKTIIGSFINTENVGYYENAYKIAKIPVVVVTALGNVALPRVTRLIAAGKESKDFINKSMSLVMGITAAMSFGMFGIAKVFIPLYLGDSFIAAIPLFQVLAFMIVFIGWGNVLRTQCMLPKGYDMLYMKSVVYAAIVNIAMSLALVKTFGALGVAIASLGSEVVICVFSTLKLRREINVGGLIRGSSFYIFAGMLMSALVSFTGSIMTGVRSGFLILCIQVIVGITVYFITVFFMERITKRYVFITELEHFKEQLLKHFFGKHTGNDF